ncbi:MAG TPA: hypothetical protein VK509_04845 [Polyangiales bacterium]|nr:hypothetical protein [Polyangiales bacterium]
MVVLFGLGLALAGGCESAEQKCAAARGAALGEWNGYVQALEQARDKALATQKSAAVQLREDVDKRLLPIAQLRADTRYPRSSEAWLRASKSAYNELCTADATCSAQKRDSFEAGVALDDLDERLALARAARDAMRGDSQAASQASAATILHPEYPQLKQAQARVSELRERCPGQTAARDETVSSVRR